MIPISGRRVARETIVQNMKMRQPTIEGHLGLLMDELNEAGSDVCFQWIPVGLWCAIEFFLAVDHVEHHVWFQREFFPNQIQCVARTGESELRFLTFFDWSVDRFSISTGRYAWMEIYRSRHAFGTAANKQRRNWMTECDSMIETCLCSVLQTLTTLSIRMGLSRSYLNNR